MCWGAGSTISNPPQFGQLLSPAITDFIKVETGKYHTCGLRVTQEIVCWGATIELPEQGPFIDMALGDYHTCGLHPDGTISCWKAGEMEVDVGQLSPPSGIIFRTLVAGGLHTCGLDNDGKIHCWGAGVSNFEQEPDYGQSIPPTGIFTDISFS